MDWVTPQPDQGKWFALVVRPRHEKAADQVLAIKGYDTFLPLYRRQHRYGARKREYQLPLFPGYLFCRFDPHARLPVLGTPSIIQIVGAGRSPVAVDDAEMNSLRIAAVSPFVLTPHPYLEAGRRVQILGGPLAGVNGTILQFKDSMRLILSVTMLQRSVAVEVDRALVGVG